MQQLHIDVQVSPRSPHAAGRAKSASAPGPNPPEHEPCQRCGVTFTTAWRPAALGGPKVLCNACGLKKDTLRAIHGTSDGRPPRPGSMTPRKTTPGKASVPAAPPPPAVLVTPDSNTSGPAAAAADKAAVMRTPTRRSQAAAAAVAAAAAAAAVGDPAPAGAGGLSRETTPEPSPRPAEAMARQSQAPPPLFKSPRAPDAACSPARTRSGMTPLKSPGTGGFQTPANRMRPTNRGPISPATSHDARQLMFLSAPKSHREPQAKGKAAPKSAPAKGPGSSISERNRAAAMARWHVTSPPVTVPPSCRKCGLDLTGIAPSSGVLLCDGCRNGGRKRKSADPADDEPPCSPITRSAGRAAAADADADFSPTYDAGVAAPRPSKKPRRGAARKGGDGSGSGKRPGRPPKWPERGEPAARDAAAAMLPGDFTRVEQIVVEAPGRAPFKLARLAGAPHGQPALALRQVQVALVPHTDRTSAFYLAMIRAAEAVGGLVRSATRPEMALLVSGGALAKGACRASIGTFPAVTKGLERLGVDLATIAALNVHDTSLPTLHTPLPALYATNAAGPDAAAAGAGTFGADVAAAAVVPATLGSIAEGVAASSPPGIGRRGARPARKSRADDAAGATDAAAAQPGTEPMAVPAAMAAPASAVTTSVSHRRRRRKPCKSVAPAAVLAPMFASPEPRTNVSGGSADTTTQVDPTWSLPPNGTETARPSRQASRPRRFSPEPGITSDDGCSGRGKRRRMSTSSSAGGQQQQQQAAAEQGPGRQEEALRELGIHAAWLPLLQHAPSAAMHAAARQMQWQQPDGGSVGAISVPESCEGAVSLRKGEQHVTFEKPSPTDSGASDGGHIRSMPYEHLPSCVNITAEPFGGITVTTY